MKSVNFKHRFNVKLTTFSQALHQHDSIRLQQCGDVFAVHVSFNEYLLRAGAHQCSSLINLWKLLEMLYVTIGNHCETNISLL